MIVINKKNAGLIPKTLASFVLVKGFTFFSKVTMGITSAITILTGSETVLHHRGDGHPQSSPTRHLVWEIMKHLLNKSISSCLRTVEDDGLRCSH